MRIPDGIFFRTLTLAQCPEGEAARVLSAGEQAQARRFTLEKRRRQFILGRLTLRLLAGEHLGVPPNRVPVVVADDGAVELDGSDWSVSLAHSEHRAVAAISRIGPVGVDVERIQPRHPGVGRFLLHPDEYPLVEAERTDRDARIVLIWTLKEAVLKGLRTGFRLSPRALRLSLDEEAGEASIRVGEQQTWRAGFQECDGFYLSVAYPVLPVE